MLSMGLMVGIGVNRNACFILKRVLKIGKIRRIGATVSNSSNTNAPQQCPAQVGPRRLDVIPDDLPAPDQFAVTE